MSFIWLHWSQFPRVRKGQYCGNVMSQQDRILKRGHEEGVFSHGFDARHLNVQLKKMRLDCEWEFLVVVGKHRMNQEAPVTVSTAVCLPLESSASPVSSLQQIYCRRVLRARRGRVVHTVLFGGGGLVNSFRKFQSVLTWLSSWRCPPPTQVSGS